MKRKTSGLMGLLAYAGSVGLIAGLLSLVNATPAFAIAGCKACGDVGGLGLVRGKPLIGLTLAILEAGDQRGPIPLNRVTKGQAGAAAIANTLSDNDPVPGTGTDPKKPDFIIGPILTPGNPPTTAGVGTRKVMVSTGFPTYVSADAEANIAASVQMGAGGAILGATAFTSTDCSANAKGLGTASAVASAGTDPFVLDPLPSGLRAQLTVDLIYNYSGDPTAAFGMYADASQGSAANGNFDLQVLSNIPGKAKLVDLMLNANSAQNSVNVIFASPVMSQPIFSSDFMPESSVPGLYSLSPGKKSFSFIVDLPAGPLGIDDQGSYGVTFDLRVSGNAMAVATVPEPTTLVLLFVTVLTGGFGVRRRDR